MPQTLSCSRFKNDQIDLRKCQIQKHKNTENKILNSNKNIVEKNRNMENTRGIIFFCNLIYFIGDTVKLDTDDIVNKSVVFRIKETSCHITHG